MSEKIKISIEKPDSLLTNKELKIPTYQRPYKWKQKNVTQLLDDIMEGKNRKMKSYRIGTAILHEENQNLNIVDGQQRLVTLTMILHLLNHENLSLLKSAFDHEFSKSNIAVNYRTIINWFSVHNNSEQDELKKYILSNCEFVVIVIDDLSEAFQLFDSQNARGKPLEAYDLLKAFHLREMYHNTEQEKHVCVKNWEDAIDNDGLLKSILAEYLYRIRKWSRGEDAGYFTNNEIEEFKGIDIFKHRSFPYLKSHLMNDSLVDEMQLNVVHKTLGSTVGFPFQINQMIINGKRFFEYIDFYKGVYDHLFKNENTGFLSFYKNSCEYNGSERAGDKYVKHLFKALVIFYYDKFGKESFEEYYRILYRFAYHLRLKQVKVNYTSVDKYLRDNNNSFQTIHKSYYPAELVTIKRHAQKPGEIKRSIPEVEKNYES